MAQQNDPGLRAGAEPPGVRRVKPPWLLSAAEPWYQPPSQPQSPPVKSFHPGAAGAFMSIGTWSVQPGLCAVPPALKQNISKQGYHFNTALGCWTQLLFPVLSYVFLTTALYGDLIMIPPL